MFLEIFRFECRYQLRGALFSIIAAMFFLFGFFAMASDRVTIGAADSDTLKLNGAYIIVVSSYVFSIIALLAGAAFVAAPITRDHDLRTSEVFVATGVPRLSFLSGRFAGGLLFAFLATGAAVLGTLLGTFWPYLDPERLAPFSWTPYLYSLFVVVLPNVFIPGAFLFAVGAWSRSLVTAYVVAVALVIIYFIVGANTDQETLHITALLDPFGTTAFEQVTRYWTASERNVLVPPVAGYILWNRLIWFGLASAALLVTAWRFRFELGSTRARKRAARDTAAQPIGSTIGTEHHTHRRFDGRLVWRQFVSQVSIDVRGVLRSIPFYVLVLFGVANTVGGFYLGLSETFGTRVLPVTGFMLDTIAGSFMFVVIMVVIYYGGELMQRERDTRLAEIAHASPVPMGAIVAAKVAALIGIVLVLITAIMMSSIIVQALHGYYEFEIPVYLFGLYVVQGWPVYLLCVVSIVVQALTRQKFVGMAIVLAFFLLLEVLDSFGFEHPLLQLGVPAAPYSDMNGFGHFVTPLLYVGLYWTAIAGLLCFVAHLFAERGYVDNRADRWRVARGRLTPVVSRAMVVLAAFALGLGVWIFYNMDVLNRYETQEDLERAQADYEKRYKALRDVPQPEPVALDVAIDVYPDERRLESRGTAQLQNTDDEPITELHLTLPQKLDVNTLEVDGARTAETDDVLGYRRLTLATPLAPGASIELRWDLSWRNPGFVARRSTTRVVRNGTFVDNTEIMPLPGYQTDRELRDNNIRRKYDLPAVERLPKYDSATPTTVNQFGVRTRAAFHAVLSTTDDQIAVAPGYLTREWSEGGRKYFEYTMDAPIFPFVSFMSARYAERHDRWSSPSRQSGDVAIDVFHHPTHDYNVARMITATQKSLDYFEQAFGPYQYRQFRILEFPRYQVFAQSFPNTIPYSEAIGFVADLRDPKDIDYVFYVTAHELAHQWWGHQVVGARVQGETVLVETLAQYSALMVMEHEYGPTQMRRFLRYELDRYLSRRGGELIEELPLAHVEDQPYIHYSKGSVVMYALKDAIGEEAVNRALRRLIAEFGMKGAPYPRTGDLIALFREEAGPEHQALITDLFEKITLFDLAVSDAKVEEQPDGKFKVTASLSTRKLEANGSGEEHEAPMDVVLDVAVFPAKGKDLGENDLPPPLALERRHFTGGRTEVQFVVDQRPSQIGIDPYSKMIDRNPDDNLKEL